MPKEEIARLLNEAASAGARGDMSRVSAIEVALCRAIPSYEHYMLDTPTAYTVAYVERLFMGFYRLGADPVLVESFYSAIGV